MDNNKLGLKIVRINQGYTDLFEINGDQEWTKNVWDIRKDLENIDGLDGSSAVLMLTCVDTGHLLTVASLIESRITDCISAWIYIPISINIAGKELIEVVDAVKKEILANERNDEKLTQLFSKSYESALATRITAKSNGEKCAYRCYGQGAKYTLSELLKDMCQSYYKNYKSIFLLDNASKLRCLTGDNLSDQKVCSMVVVKSPGKKDSFVPYIGEQPFVEQMYAVEGEVVRIQWRRNGYLSISTETTVCQDMKFSVPTPNEYIKVIPYESIKVVDEWGQAIREYDVYVDNNLIENGRPIVVSESKINNVCVEIYAEGFESINKNVNLTQPVKIKLAKETYAYEFMLPLKNGKDYSIKISGDRKIKNSPVEGYVTKNGHITRYDKNYLQFKPFTRKFWIYSIIVLLLSICVGYALNYFIGAKEDNQEVSKLNQENTKLKNIIKELETKRNYNYSPKGTADNTEDYSNEAAISYLDNNNKWNRTEMEKFEVLNGLWDALNKRQFDVILKYEGKLSDSNTFTEVLKAVKANKHKKFPKAYSDNYDIRIKPEENKGKGYIKALNDALETASATKKENEMKNNNSNSQDRW